MDSSYFRVASWNVNGLRALLKVPSCFDFVKTEDPDVIFLSEVKCDDGITSSIKFPQHITDSYPYVSWNCCQVKKGYSGLLMLSKQKPLSYTNAIGLRESDSEGRVIIAEFKDFYLVNCYVPNSGMKLENLDWRISKFEKKMTAFLKELKQKKTLFYSGDLNVAHTEIDVWNSKGNQRTAGHTPQERAAFTELLSEGFIDVWRQQNPGKIEYSFYGARSGGKAGGKGWRLDYFVAGGENSDKMSGPVRILGDVEGSDHQPLLMDILVSDPQSQGVSVDKSENNASERKSIKNFFSTTKKSSTVTPTEEDEANDGSRQASEEDGEDKKSSDEDTSIPLKRRAKAKPKSSKRAKNSED